MDTAYAVASTVTYPVVAVGKVGAALISPVVSTAWNVGVKSPIIAATATTAVVAGTAYASPVLATCGAATYIGYKVIRTFI